MGGFSNQFLYSLFSRKWYSKDACTSNAISSPTSKIQCSSGCHFKAM